MDIETKEFGIKENEEDPEDDISILQFKALQEIIRQLKILNAK